MHLEGSRMLQVDQRKTRRGHQVRRHWTENDGDAALAGAADDHSSRRRGGECLLSGDTTD